MGRAQRGGPETSTPRLRSAQPAQRMMATRPTCIAVPSWMILRFGVVLCLLGGLPVAAQREVVNGSGQRLTAEVVEGSTYLQLRDTRGHLHIEHGPLAAGVIDPGWWSSMWEVEPVDETYFRLRNRWKGIYLHIEPGTLTAGEIEPEWRGALWSMADGGPMIRPRLPPAVSDYRVVVRTAAGAAAGTRSAVHLTFQGPGGRSDEIHLNPLLPAHGLPGGSRPEAVVRQQPNVGAINRISIRMPSSADDPWRIAELTLESTATGVSYTRRIDAWIYPGQTLELEGP
jgi:hypothetical protein